MRLIYVCRLVYITQNSFIANFLIPHILGIAMLYEIHSKWMEGIWTTDLHYLLVCLDHCPLAYHLMLSVWEKDDAHTKNKFTMLIIRTKINIFSSAYLQFGSEWFIRSSCKTSPEYTVWAEIFALVLFLRISRVKP